MRVLPRHWPRRSLDVRDGCSFSGEFWNPPPGNERTVYSYHVYVRYLQFLNNSSIVLVFVPVRHMAFGMVCVFYCIFTLICIKRIFCLFFQLLMKSVDGGVKFEWCTSREDINLESDNSNCF